jgi:TonB family protein
MPKSISTLLGGCLQDIIFGLLSIALATPMTAQADTVTPSNATPSSSAPTSSDSTPPKPEKYGAPCRPWYPPTAVAHNEQGTAILDIDVSPQGTAANVVVKASSGHDSLDEVSVECVKTWIFRPATQNGVPIESHYTQVIQWRISDGSQPSLPADAPPGPANWSPYSAADSIAAYMLSNTAEAPELLAASVYSKFSGLDEFIKMSARNLQSAPGFHLGSEKQTTVCGSIPAWDIEFTRQGLVPTDPSKATTVELIASVENGFALVATYVRGLEEPKRSDADQWLHAFCEPDNVIRVTATLRRR